MAIKVSSQLPHVKSLLRPDRNVVEFPKASRSHLFLAFFLQRSRASAACASSCTFRGFSIAAFEGLSAKVYGISVDSPFALAEF